MLSSAVQDVAESADQLFFDFETRGGFGVSRSRGRRGGRAINTNPSVTPPASSPAVSGSSPVGRPGYLSVHERKFGWRFGRRFHPSSHGLLTRDSSNHTHLSFSARYR